MRYTIYRVTNLVNGKFYIGKHQTIHPLDGYFGSGKALLAAIRQYGKENFVKEILFDFDTEQDMNLKEKELVTESLVNDPMAYNMAVGGEGGPHYKGRKHTAETIEKIRLSQTGKIRSCSDVAKKKISSKLKGNKSKTGLTVSDETKEKIAKSMTGRQHTEETKAKLRAARLQNLSSRLD